MTENELISLVEESQKKYIKKRKRVYLKENSQFFTPKYIADKMLNTINIKNLELKKNLKILEPSAGTGILIMYTLLFLFKNSNIKEIEFDIYELDAELFKTLKKNITSIKSYFDKMDSKIKFNLFNENFIEHNSVKWNKKNSYCYDLIIANPPFKKINQDSSESKVMKELIYGQPNIYTLFIAMSLKLLDHNGVFCVLSPRNYLSGEYSKKVRNFIFKDYQLSHIHTFDKRDIFQFVNQEVIISTYMKTSSKVKIEISHNGKFKFKTDIENIIYDQGNKSILIPNKKSNLSLLKKFLSFSYSLKELGLKVSVGPIVQFRNQNFLSRDVFSDNYSPLLISNDIKEDNIIYYYNRKNIRKTHNKSINNKAKYLLPNSNYLLLRKVTAKDDHNTIISTVLEKDFFNAKFIGLDNNLLYFHKINKDEEMSLEECYGLYGLINSCYFKEFYSLINGTHTINVSDFKNMQFPSLESIKKIGNYIIKNKVYNENYCSYIVKKNIDF